ncbi:MAG: branched-chain amino acid ABC transporter permease [Desulfobacterales bacterium]|nr:MAG: branched-chain amino acid ABC transporter permease [Desulfobacterales bacterium]
MVATSVHRRKKRLDRGIKARTDTIFLIASWKDMLYLLLPRMLPVAILLVLPVLVKGYWGKVLVYACIYGLLALSWDFMAAGGLFSLGQALFFGLGAYLAGILNYYLHLPPVVTVPAATLGGGLLSAALLGSVVRLKGVYFAMITLMLPLLFKKVIETTGAFGGTHGLPSLTPFPSELLTAYLAVGGFLGSLFIFRRVINSDYGLVLRAIKDDDRAVMSGAINIYGRKIQAIFISGAVGSFAGALMTHYYQFLGMSVFALDYSILPVAAVALGGQGTFAGAAMGSLILVPLSESLRALGGLRIAIYCGILIVSIIGFPEGLFHYLARKYHQFERVVEVK